MGRELRRIRRRRAALERIDELSDRTDSVLVVHYSCESFYNRTDGTTPRVTTIAVRNLGSGQTDTFSIHRIAEQRYKSLANIQQHYDELENELLTEFFEFVRTHQNYTWVHWNMRDINYGFAALEHRYRVLGGTSVQIEESRKFDLARAMVAIYGLGYIGHPRLTKLIDKNRITRHGFLTGQEESDAFDRGDYIALHQSTLRKVDILANILERVADNSIKTNARWREIYGVSPKALAEVLRDHWIMVLVSLIAIAFTLLGGIDLIYKWHRSLRPAAQESATTIERQVAFDELPCPLTGN